MAVTYTENYNLGKQENHSDKFDMAVITENMDKIDTALADKVDKESGKGLSTNDFTDADKSKLDSLENYDDADIAARLAALEEKIVALEGGVT